MCLEESLRNGRKVGSGLRIIRQLRLPILAAGLAAGASAAGDNATLLPLMPLEDDHTSMWWAEGFPGVIPEAPWIRCIQTGKYAMAMDTRSLAISHLGSPPAPGETLAGMSGKIPAVIGMEISVDGTLYRCEGGREWSRFGGPRVIESGRFLQRSDIYGLDFKSDEGKLLNVEARLETSAWPDRIGFAFAARPGLQALRAGEDSFGRIGGGYGLDGTNDLTIPHSPELDTETFTLSLWAFIPGDHGTNSWLVCKNHHEAADGNYGITISNGKITGRLNVGGGSDSAFAVAGDVGVGRDVKPDAWNHLALSYDGGILRFWANGKEIGNNEVGRARSPGNRSLAFGRREDHSGDGYRFRGVIDEVEFYGRALAKDEIVQLNSKPGEPLPGDAPARKWAFRKDGKASMVLPGEVWKDASMRLELAAGMGRAELLGKWKLEEGAVWKRDHWQQVSVGLDPVGYEELPGSSPIDVKARVIGGGIELPVGFDPEVGWHRINLDASEPVFPPGPKGQGNDAIERVNLRFSNPSKDVQTARILFSKEMFRQKPGTPITGISAILRAMDGNPTGIPVQLSKNWHNRPEGGFHSGTWFHGITQIRLPAGRVQELELTIAYGHWGGVSAASHSQLSLIGWGGNQFWDQSALGSWGESICYDPEQAQANCTITDVRPLMVTSMEGGKDWRWTTNVGGGDFFRFFDAAGTRIPHSSMRTAYRRYGPCLTEATYSGKIGGEINQEMTVSLSRTDDLVRGCYRIRMDVVEPVDFSRFVVFQVGADTYNSTAERKIAFGNENGLIKEFDARWGGDTYRGEPIECTGRIPWASLHGAVAQAHTKGGAVANRGIIIRSWKARIGGKESRPWMAERGITRGKSDSSIIDVIPPPGVKRFEKGDFIEAVIEHVAMPQFSKDYYGPNGALRETLARDGDTWKMIRREAVGNDRAVVMRKGGLSHVRPDVRIRTEGGEADFTLKGGLGYVAVTFSGLPSHDGCHLEVDGKPLDQSVHGNDFWQTDHDPKSRTWSRTYNIPMDGVESREVRLIASP